MRSERLIRGPREGYPLGETPIVREDDRRDPVGFDLSIRRLRVGERVEERSQKESVWLLMQGEAVIEGPTVRRASLFDEPPTALSVGPDTPVSIESKSASEWAVIRARNERAFEPRLFLPEMLETERRGAGLAQDACVREVRLVFDARVRPESCLVVGEVVSHPGRWSSYPPHHHPQPELYHYRFTEPQGYGHAELDDEVFKVRALDSIKIMGGETHAQVCAPGYAMYYLWIVRHLPGRPYQGFEFVPEHRWLLDPAKQGWTPHRGDGRGDG